MNNGMVWILAGGVLLFLVSRKRLPSQTAGTATSSTAVDSTQGNVGTGTGPVPTDEVLEKAALDASQAQQAGPFRLNWHQWNYYRAQAAIKNGLCAPPCPEYAPVLGERVGLTDAQTITASEYHNYLTQIAGMSGVAAWRRINVYRRPWA